MVAGEVKSSCQLVATFFFFFFFFFFFLVSPYQTIEISLGQPSPGADPGGGGGALGAEAPPFIFRLYLINMLSIIMKFCLSIII